MTGSDNHGADLVASVTSARVLALEYVVQLLIASHPDRELLRAMWNLRLPEQLDEWLQEPGYTNNEAFRTTLHAKLAELQGFLDVQIPGADEADE